MKRIMILQPGYLPWLGFFDMLYKSRALVLHTDIQYDKGSWRNRNRIRTAKGWSWLTVPVHLKGHAYDKILEIRIDNSKGWKRRHLNLLRENYRKAPCFDDYYGTLTAILNKEWKFLVDLDLALIDWLLKELGIRRELIFSHDLKLDGTKNTSRLISICKQVEADTYLSGSKGRNYIRDELFRKEGIKLEYHDYVHPVYKQQFEGFIPYMSVIDLLFNHGDESLGILTRMDEKKEPSMARGKEHYGNIKV